MRRLLLAVAVLAVAAAIAAAAVGPGRSSPRAAGDRPGGAARPAPTPAPELPTPAALARGITRADVAPHLRGLAAAARSGGGNRAAGTAGDRASVAYVEASLRAAGWRVSRETVRFPFFEERRPPRVAVGGKRLAVLTDVATLEYSSGGTVGAGVHVIRRGIDSGCRAADFAGLQRGEVALIRRGTCTLRSKARRAERAGAAAALIVNHGEADETGTFAGTLGSPGIGIPVLALSVAAGERVVEDARVELSVDAVSERRSTTNVIADAGTGRRVVMAGGHLDSVDRGPGMNDNGSGVAALLAIADAVGGASPPAGRLRLAFWGAEELGLYGSRRHVARLSRAERRRVAAYINLDMVGTPRGRLAIYEGDARISRALRAGFRFRGRRTLAREALDDRSDHAPFARAGIPVGGIFTGIDRCYHRRCDDLDNVDRRFVAASAGAAGAALVVLAG